MGLFSGLGSFFGGPLGGLIGGIGDDIIGRDDAENANQTAYAQQRELRQTAYQDTTKDLQAAGLNPMLAYSNGATAAAGGPPVINKGQASAQQNSAQATTQNLEADTYNKTSAGDLMKAQAEEIRSRVPVNNNTAKNVAATTEQVIANTNNLKAELSRIEVSKELMGSQARQAEAQRALAEAQRELANMEKALKEGAITLQDAQTKGQNIINQLKAYEIPGAKNLADFEKMLETGGGNAAGVAGTAINTVRKALGK
jgi:hypothetical protein